jgi:hypothetical protein
MPRLEFLGEFASRAARSIESVALSSLPCIETPFAVTVERLIFPHRN